MYVIYFRQTATRDIQPRLESLLRQHVPEARTFILKNTVDAERREAVIEREIAKGTNVVLCNPELVKTGLDLIYFPTSFSMNSCSISARSCRRRHVRIG